MMEENIYYRYVGEHGGTSGRLQSGQDLTEQAEGKGKGRWEGNQVQLPKGQRSKETGDQNVWVI